MTAFQDADAVVQLHAQIGGLDWREFTFFGFVPRTGRQRKVKLAQVAAERRACVLYEAPHRIVATLRCARNGPAPERPHA